MRPDTGTNHFAAKAVESRTAARRSLELVKYADLPDERQADVKQAIVGACLQFIAGAEQAARDPKRKAKDIEGYAESSTAAAKWRPTLEMVAETVAPDFRIVSTSGLILFGGRDGGIRLQSGINEHRRARFRGGWQP